MKKFIMVLIIIVAFFTWNAAAYACEAYDAATMQHTTNYSSTSIIEWEEPTVEETTVIEEPTVEEKSTVTEETTVIEESTVEEESTATEEAPVETVEETVNSSAKAEIKAKAEEETEKVASAGVSEKHFVQTGLLEDYRALEDKVIYLITALLISLLAYMPFNRKKAEARRKER